MLVSNATLVRINAGSGDLDDYATGSASTSEQLKWSGSVGAYIERKTIRVAGPAGSEYQKQWKVYLQRDRPGIILEPEDQLTLVQSAPDGSQVTITVPVLMVDDRYQPDMPADVQTLAVLVEPSAPG